MSTEYILGLDYGSERVGVAIAHQIARLPRPLTTLKNDENLTEAITTILHTEGVGRIVVGVPRNMDGTASSQSATCEAFAAALAETCSLPVDIVDETLSSVEAEARLGTRAAKPDIDAMAAAIILERYFSEQYLGGNIHEL